MNARDKYNQVFIESFSLNADQLNDGLAYNQTPSWDSIGHMAMVSALETAFGITLETDDIVNFSSYKKGFEIMAKYGISIDS